MKHGFFTQFNLALLVISFFCFSTALSAMPQEDEFLSVGPSAPKKRENIGKSSYLSQSELKLVDLNKDVLALIFSFISFDQRVKAAVSCKRFQEIDRALCTKQLDEFGLKKASDQSERQAILGHQFFIKAGIQALRMRDLKYEKDFENFNVRIKNFKNLLEKSLHYKDPDARTARSMLASISLLEWPQQEEDQGSAKPFKHTESKLQELKNSIRLASSGINKDIVNLCKTYITEKDPEIIQWGVNLFTSKQSSINFCEQSYFILALRDLKLNPRKWITMQTDNPHVLPGIIRNLVQGGPVLSFSPQPNLEEAKKYAQKFIELQNQIAIDQLISEGFESWLREQGFINTDKEEAVGQKNSLLAAGKKTAIKKKIESLKIKVESPLPHEQYTDGAYELIEHHQILPDLNWHSLLLDIEEGHQTSIRVREEWKNYVQENPDMSFILKDLYNH